MKTNRQIVLEHFPDARAKTDRLGVKITTRKGGGEGGLIGWGDTHAEAWADVVRNMEDEWGPL